MTIAQNQIKTADIDGEASHGHDMQYQLDHSHADDLRINSLSRCVRTRLYFTSESHLHTLLNVLKFSKNHPTNRYPEVVTAVCPEGILELNNIKELSYLTQIVIRLFEDRNDPMKCRCEITLSPGKYNHN